MLILGVILQDANTIMMNKIFFVMFNSLLYVAVRILLVDALFPAT